MVRSGYYGKNIVYLKIRISKREIFQAQPVSLLLLLLLSVNYILGFNQLTLFGGENLCSGLLMLVSQCPN